MKKYMNIVSLFLLGALFSCCALIYTGTQLLFPTLLFLFTGLILILAYGNRIVKVYPDVKQDYRHEFPTETSETHLLSLEKETLRLPRGNWDTCVMEVTLKANGFGIFRTPSIAATIDGETTRFHFEPRLHGKRYIVLSRKEHQGTTITLTGKGLSIVSSRIPVYLYTNIKIADTTSLILAPHPDDAEISSFGLYSHSNSWILTTTAGETGSFRYKELYPDPATQYRVKGKLRVWNSITVPMLGNVSPQQSVNLGYFNGSLKWLSENPGKAAVSKTTDIKDVAYFRNINVSSYLPENNQAFTWETLVEDIMAFLKVAQPAIIATPYPAIDSHHDHQMTTKAVMEAIRKLGYWNTSLYLYSVHYPKAKYYPYGPLGSGVPLPPKFTDRPLPFSRIHAIPLDSHTRNMKILALDAMNDLRPNTEWRFPARMLLRNLNRILNTTILGIDSSLFRRNIRATELFFVLEAKELKSDAVVDAILTPL